MVVLLAQASLMSAFADEPFLELHPGYRVQPLGYIQHYTDPSTSESVETILERDFELAETMPNFGYSNAAHWFKINVTNPRQTEQEWFIRSGLRFMRPLEVFTYDGETVQKIIHVDEKQTFSEREVGHRLILVPFTIEPEASLTLYVRFVSGGVATLPFYFVQGNEFKDDDANGRILLVFICAVILSFVIVNFYHFIASGNMLHLLYCLQEISAALYILHLEGFAFQYLWPNFPGFNAIASPVIGSVQVVFAIMFATSFLKTAERSPALHRILMFLLFAAVLNTLMCFFIDLRITNQLGLIIGVFSVVIAVAASAKVTYQGHVVGPYFAAAWIVRMFGIFQFGWVAGGLDQEYVITTLSWFEASVALQAIIFSLGLDAQHRRLAKEHEETHALLVESLNKRLVDAQDLVQLEQEKAKALAEVKDKSKTIATTSHDVMQPVRSLKLALSQTEITEPVQFALDSIEDILRDSLGAAQSKLESFSSDTSVDIEQLLNELARSFHTEAMEKNLFIRVHSHRQALTTSATSLRRCISNLVSNAIRNTATGGVLLASRRRKNAIVIQVFDTGVGMTEDEIHEFSQLLAKGDQSIGHGLGLVIVNELCQRNDWQFGLRSTEGRGTCASIVIPI